jgi:hypothetical protein
LSRATTSLVSLLPSLLTLLPIPRMLFVDHALALSLSLTLPSRLDFAKDNLVMIPNGDQKRLLFYLNTLLLDFMATILKELETLVLISLSLSLSVFLPAHACAWRGHERILSSMCYAMCAQFENETAWASAYISTPLDPHNPSADKVNRLKKRKAGRVSKTKGDYCLLAGDPLDALN